jgi:hypothetical protein
VSDLHYADADDEADYEFPDEPLECLEAHTGECRGAVEYRMSLTGTGLAIERCDYHWDKRLQLEEQITERYGHDSDLAPDWIDESYIGERWMDD